MKKYNLDLGVEEYFEFSIKGHNYKFKHLTTDELKELSSMEKDDSDKATEYMYSFIESVDDAPDFKEVAKTLSVPYLLAFRKMIKTEFGIDESKS
jgi:hypothetical protein